MRVLLVNPSQQAVYGFEMQPTYPPLGILYVAAVFENENCSVRFLDMDAEQISQDKISQRLAEFRPDLVGITSLTPTINIALSIAKIAKNVERKVKVLLGGVHPTVLPFEVINNEYVDFVIEGEAEISARELIRQLKSDNPDYTKISGLWYKLDGKIFSNPRHSFINELDTIRFPARHLINNPKKYFGQDALRLPIANIITSRGCPGRCTFCQTKQILGRTFRYRSAKNIIAEIDILVNRFNVKEIHIMDDVFTLNKNRILELCQMIKSRNYDLSFQIANGLRADMVDEEVLKALKSIGLLNVGFGVETGSEVIMRKIKKEEITKEKVRHAYRIAKKIGFETWAFFILGLPGETELTIKETIDFAKELDPDFAKFLILKPFPGSEVFEELNSKGLIFDHSYENYGLYTQPVHRLEEMNERDILSWQKKAFREFYFRPQKLIKLLLRKWTFVRIGKTINSFYFILRRSF
jgi:radical SAM superfamily enzyme YgiQ (UPF0313 family)